MTRLKITKNGETVLNEEFASEFVCKESYMDFVKGFISETGTYEISVLEHGETETKQVFNVETLKVVEICNHNKIYQIPVAFDEEALTGGIYYGLVHRMDWYESPAYTVVKYNDKFYIFNGDFQEVSQRNVALLF